MKKIWYFLVAGMLIFTLTACGGGTDETKDDNANDTAKDENNADTNNETGNDAADDNAGEETADKNDDKGGTDNLKVGDSADLNGLVVTLNEARLEQGSEYDTPENAKFIVVNLTAQNNTKEDQTISSIMNVELKDADGYTYTTTILMEGTKGQFDGTVAPGDMLRGEIPFDVPESDTYELSFSDPFSSDRAVWVIPNSELK